MIALWMLYALLVGCGFSLAGLVAERAFRWLGWSVRFVWVVVLVLSAAVPFTNVLIAPELSTVQAMAPSAAVKQAGPWLVLVDRSLLYGWLFVVVVLSISGVLALRSLVRARRHWRTTELQGARVLISRDFGPGVVAFGPAQIVLPAWALELDAGVQELMLRHEHEHLRARDHWLILGGLILLVLCPFNLVLWWQFRRLKLAIEMDCDARVLSGRQDAREYAALLLDVGVRCRSARLVFAAFAAPPHAIERRIRMLLDRKKESRRLAGWLTAAGAVVLGILACQTPDPGSPEDAVRSALGINEPPPPPPPPPGPKSGEEIEVVSQVTPRGTVELKSENALREVDIVCRFKGRDGANESLDCSAERTLVRAKLPPPPPPPPLPDKT